MKKTYRYRPADYDREGRHRSKPDYLFTDFLRECEADFHEKYKPCFANTMRANTTTNHLLKVCFDTEFDHHFGMESIDGEVDIDMNLEIEMNSLHKTIYALGSELEGNKDEPLYLVTAEKFFDAKFTLSYNPDHDGEEAEPDDAPTGLEEVNREPARCL